MRRPRTRRAIRSSLAVGAAICAVLVTPAPALASVDDSFAVTTNDQVCSFYAGWAYYVDYGPGVPGNGASNDDYVEILDTCSDGDGVKVWAWLNGKLLGSKYNGNGAGGASVIWDPFPSGNVSGGDLVGLKICSANGTNGTPYNCGNDSYYSADG